MRLESIVLSNMLKKLYKQAVKKPNLQKYLIVKGYFIRSTHTIYLVNIPKLCN